MGIPWFGPQQNYGRGAPRTMERLPNKDRISQTVTIELRTKWSTMGSKVIWFVMCKEKLGFALKKYHITCAMSWAFVKIQMLEMNLTDIALLDGSKLVGTDRALPSLTL